MEKESAKIQKVNRFLFLLPLLGLALFVLFYVMAALQYPGGSRIHPNETGFSFWNNYLCDLLDIETINGLPNPARDYSRVALFVLCSGLILFWYYVPRLFGEKNGNGMAIRATGMGSMFITLFMTNSNHDMVVRLAGIFGVVALVLLMIQLLRAAHVVFFRFGLFCLLVFLVNYYIYETNIYIEALPVIQKITFISFLSWFALLDVAIYKRAD
ncbi:MAG: hypothetical protein R2819_12355 [Allomuricauda sp.]